MNTKMRHFISFITVLSLTLSMFIFPGTLPVNADNGSSINALSDSFRATAETEQITEDSNKWIKRFKDNIEDNDKFFQDRFNNKPSTLETLSLPSKMPTITSANDGQVKIDSPIAVGSKWAHEFVKREPIEGRSSSRLGDASLPGIYATVSTPAELTRKINECLYSRNTSFTIKYTGDSSGLQDDINYIFDDIFNYDDYLYYSLYGNYSCSGTNGDINITFTFQYLTSKEQEDYITVKISKILSEIIKDDMNVYGREKAIHDYIVSHTAYNATSSSAYNALYDGRANCLGYALLACRLLERSGMGVRIVVGSAGGGGHAWNLVKIAGNWYHLDCTWDDPVPDVEGRVLYGYYNLTDTQMTVDHVWDAGYYPVVAAAAYVDQTPDDGIITFPDANLNVVIKECLDKTSTASIFKSDVLNISNFYAAARNISNLEGLQYMTYVKSLYLLDNKITDISILSSLTNLAKLNLDGNQISDVNPLKGLSNLTILSLAENEISNIFPLNNLLNLESLYLDDNQISDISAVSGLTKLTRLDFSFNQISNISALQNLVNLTILDLIGNSISDISIIARLANLEILGLGMNLISSISALSGLTKLKSLFLVDNRISDISPLSNLVNLTELYLSFNEISDIGLLNNLTNLTRLYLSHNQIRNISALRNLTNLTILNLSANPIGDYSPVAGYYDKLKNKDFTLTGETPTPTPAPTPIPKPYISLPVRAVITDTVMHPSWPVLYAVDNANYKVYAINYENGRIFKVGFNLQPERIEYSNGKIYVTLLKAPHNSYINDNDQKGAVEILDALNLSFIKRIDVDIDPFDVVISGDYIYLSPGSSQWENIKSYSETSKQFISSYTMYERSYIELNPILNKIYTIDTNIYPRGIEEFSINNGTFTGLHNSSYHSETLCTNFRISPDGKYVFNGSGLILTCNADANKDLRYVFMLNKQFSDIAFDTGNNKFYTAVSGKMIYSYSYNTFEGIDTFYSEGDVSYLYYRSNKLIALSKTNSSWNIVEEISIIDEGSTSSSEVISMQLTKQGSKYELNYTVKDSVAHPVDPVIYITDSTNNKIASINYETGEVKELNKFYSPESIAYYNNQLFVGYGKQGKIEIYDAQTLAYKDVIFTGASFFDLNIGNDGLVYTSSGCLEAHPLLNVFYTVTTGVSPRDLYVINYYNGSFTGLSDSPYHGDYSLYDNIRISPDGKYIFNGSGNIFICSSEKSQNMRYMTKLNKSFSDVVFDTENNRFYTGVSGNLIYVYNYSTFQGIDAYSTLGNVKKLYMGNNKLISISATSQGKDIIELINIAPTPIAYGKPNNINISHINYNSCTITWETDESASSQVEYGLTSSYGSNTENDTTPVKNHMVVVTNLSTNTIYHFKIHSINSNSVDIASDDIIFYTKDLSGINLGAKVDRMVFDASSNKAYAIDKTGMKLQVINLTNRTVEKIVALDASPSDLCLSEDYEKLYTVNFNGTVSEYSMEDFTKAGDIQLALPKYDTANVIHFHIQYKSGKLYLADGSWAPVLWTIDLNSLESKKVTGVDSIGDLVFSKTSNYFYYWHQYGWSAGWAGSYIHKYLIEDTEITNAGTSKSTYPTGMNRDPLNSPIMLLEEHNKLVCKNKVFNTVNLSDELNTFSEDIYAVSGDGSLAAGKNGIYSLVDYKKVADTAKPSSDAMIFDINKCLFYVNNVQGKMYYDESLALILVAIPTPAPTPTPIATPTPPVVMPTPEPTPTPTATPTPTPTPMPSSTPTPTPTPSPAATYMVKGRLVLYSGDNGTGLNTLVLNNLNLSAADAALKALKFIIKRDASDPGTEYKGTDIFEPDIPGGNLAMKDKYNNNRITGIFKFNVLSRNVIVRVEGAGYLAKEFNINISAGQPADRGVSLTSPIEIYPGDVGRIGSGLELLPNDIIDNVDFSAWLKIYKDAMSGTASAENMARADFTKDGDIDNIDFSLWLASYKKVMSQ